MFRLSLLLFLVHLYDCVFCQHCIVCSLYMFCGSWRFYYT